MTEAKFTIFRGTDKLWHIDEHIDIGDVGLHGVKECADAHIAEFRKGTASDYQCTDACKAIKLQIKQREFLAKK